MLKSLLVGSALAMLPALAQAASPEPKGFRDWMAGCDNLKSCTALSVPSDAVDTTAYLRLERPAGPDGASKLVLRLRGEWQKPPLAVALKLDGVAFPAGGKAMPVTADADLASVAFQPAETAAFIEAARKATKLSVAAPGVLAEVSLSGAVAALLWIDEQQGRLNTPSALIRKGSVGTAPAAPALPVVTAKPASGTLSEKNGKALATALRKQIKQRDPDQCEDGEMTTKHDQAWPLDGKRSLVSLTCSLGAYNASNAFWIVENGAVASARPVEFPQNDDSEKNVLINGEFEPKTGRIDYFAKGRGIGDCGAAGGYAWTGTSFALTGFSMMGECRGIGSDDWITLFRSEVRTAK
ncbi:DUF1176 domain-containing protein [Bosea sp. Root483D1]|uniref:DUF1176 domain-containing protein n=1 Tax=Bosea sp. Root483D1 TaxID=1736544 RepID=UPI00138F2217|nr:DUF1176 domain-containing protein [Bosea sp. Root483D1]